MKISYIVPTLNSAKTLNRTLLSLRAQEQVDVDIIVVDSDSKDGTLDICKRWNVKVLYCKPGNMYEAINVGLSQCQTPWIAYLNSDDWLYPDATKRLISLGNSESADIVYANCDYTDFYGRFLYSFSPPKPDELLSVASGGSVGFAQQTAIFRKELYESLHGFNEDYHFSADRDFFVRALLSQARFSFLAGAPVASFRLHKSQLSNIRYEEMSIEGQRIIDSLSIRPSIYDRLIRLKWRAGNWPNYLVRMLRQSMLTQKIMFSRCKDSGSLAYGNDS